MSSTVTIQVTNALSKDKNHFFFALWQQLHAKKTYCSYHNRTSHLSGISGPD